MIILAGPIGAGKSTIAKLIGDKLNSTTYFESVESNPILEDYYYDREKWALPLQFHFLDTRFNSILDALSDDDSVLDRSIMEDKIFALRNHKDGSMNEKEYNVYLSMYETLMKQVNLLSQGKREHLLVYLEGSFETIMYRLIKRGRSYELQEDLLAYYKELYEDYKIWIEEYNETPVLRIDIDKYDVTREEDAKAVLKMVNDKLKSLEKVKLTG